MGKVRSHLRAFWITQKLLRIGSLLWLPRAYIDLLAICKFFLRAANDIERVSGTNSLQILICFCVPEICKHSRLIADFPPEYELGLLGLSGALLLV